LALLGETPPPLAVIAAATNAVVAIDVSLSPAVGVGAFGSPVNVGLFVRTTLPVPFVAVNVATPVVKTGTPFEPLTSRPKPPRFAESVPVQPTVMLVVCSNAVFGVPPSVKVTLVSFVRVNAAGVAVAAEVSPKVVRAVGASIAATSVRA
jgi:hypothetical protein